jgi:serine/threonine protein kinase
MAPNDQNRAKSHLRPVPRPDLRRDALTTTLVRERVSQPGGKGPTPGAKPSDPMIGRIIEGLYKIEAKVADGGMARVYRGVHLRMRSPLAIKLIDEELSRDPTMKQRCLAEARALTELQNNSHIVRAIDVGELPDGQLFLIMEYLRGEDLDKLLAREGPLPWRRVAAMAVQICAGLASAHRRGIIHRDMKPQNCVRIEADDDPDENPDHIKIIDFGIVRRDAEQGPTQQGFLLGTPEYLAPEFGRGVKANVSTDIYALGVTLYKLLTGKVPYKGKNALETLRLHMEGELVPPSRFDPSREIPHEIDQIVLTALAKAPKDRFASVEAMGRALRSALGLNQSGLLASPAPALRPAPAEQPVESPPIVEAPELPAPVTGDEPAEPSPSPPESTGANRATAASATVEASWSDRRVLIRRTALLTSVSAAFAIGTWLVSPAAPLAAQDAEVVATKRVDESPPPRARTPEPSPAPREAAAPAPAPAPEEPPAPPPPAPSPEREEAPLVDSPDDDPPRPDAAAEALAPEPSSEPAEPLEPAPPTEPEPDFNYASAKKLIEEQAGYLRKTCMKKSDKPLSRIDLHIDVQPKGRAKVRIYNVSSKDVRSCVRDVLSFYFDPSPRGGAFKYSLKDTGEGTLRRVPVDPTFVQVPAP